MIIQSFILRINTEGLLYIIMHSVDNSRCGHFGDSTNVLSSEQSIVSGLSPSFSPTVLDDPERFGSFLAKAHNENSVIKHHGGAEYLPRMRNTMTVELQRIGIDS